MGRDTRLYLLIELLQSSLLRLELDLQLRDVFFAVDRALQELHGREERVNALAQLVLLSDELVTHLLTVVGRLAVGVAAADAARAETERWAHSVGTRVRSTRATVSRSNLLALHRRHLTLVVLRLDLVSIVVQSQILDLQVEYMNLVKKLAVLHLQLDLLLVGFAQLAKQLLSVLLQFLQLCRLGHDR